jgi:signal transduction histidine kinase
MTNQVHTIQKLVFRTFILTTAAIMLFTMVGSVYFNYQSTEILRRNSIQKSHETLMHFMKPSLDITDTTEIRRLLKMASSENETFAVINANNDILLADYSKLNLTSSIIHNSDTINCHNLSNVRKKIHGKSYWIHCTPIYTSDILTPNQRIGTLISISEYSWLSISPMIMFFLGSLIIVFILTITMLRHILKKRILTPLLELKNHIVNKSNTPLIYENNNCIDNSAPHEIIAIRNAFEKVVSDLQNEYQMRIEATRKKVLLDMAAHVAHDILSPIAVLEASVSMLPENVPDQQINIHKEAIQCVRNIANNLLVRYRDQNSCEDINEDTHLVLLSAILQYVIDMKMKEWQANPCNLVLEIHPAASTCIINTSSISIIRTLSNLLNNSYESLDDRRDIKVYLTRMNHNIQLFITDSGCGIPADKIDDAMNGVSFKERGTGLGLSSAIKFIEGMGGKFMLTSTNQVGTEILIEWRDQ